MELEHRLIKLEFRTDNHEEEIKDLRDISKVLKESLQAIERNMLQIKWITAGAGGILLAQSVGIDTIIKALLT